MEVFLEMHFQSGSKTVSEQQNYIHFTLGKK